MLKMLKNLFKQDPQKVFKKMSYTEKFQWYMNNNLKNTGKDGQALADFLIKHASIVEIMEYVDIHNRVYPDPRYCARLIILRLHRRHYHSGTTPFTLEERDYIDKQLDILTYRDISPLTIQ